MICWYCLSTPGLALHVCFSVLSADEHCLLLALFCIGFLTWSSGRNLLDSVTFKAVYLFQIEKLIRQDLGKTYRVLLIYSKKERLQATSLTVTTWSLESCWLKFEKNLTVCALTQSFIWVRTSYPQLPVHRSTSPQRCTYFWTTALQFHPWVPSAFLGRCHPFLAICLHLVCQLKLEHLPVRTVPLVLAEDNLGARISPEVLLSGGWD